MAEEIGFENGRNSNFQGLVTLTLTLDPVIRHTVGRASLIDLYLHTKFIQMEETFCRRTDVRTYGCTDVRTYGHTDGHFPPLILLGRLLEVDLKRKKEWRWVRTGRHSAQTGNCGLYVRTHCRASTNSRPAGQTQRAVVAELSRQTWLQLSEAHTSPPALTRHIALFHPREIIHPAVSWRRMFPVSRGPTSSKTY